MSNQSERTNIKLKPRFPRLKLMELRRRDDERTGDQWDQWPDGAKTVHYTHQ